MTRGRRRLRTHAVRDDHRVLAAARYLVDALDLAIAHADAARLGARREVGEVPAWRARAVVARPDARLRLRLGRAQERRHDLVGVLADAVDDQLLDATQAGRAAAGVALLPPHVRFPRLGHTDLDRVPVEGAEGNPKGKRVSLASQRGKRWKRIAGYRGQWFSEGLKRQSEQLYL